MSRYESWRRDLDKGIPCQHQKAYVSDATPTDSDTTILTTYCPDCGDIKRDEEVGSLSRAIAQEFQWESVSDKYSWCYCHNGPIPEGHPVYVNDNASTCESCDKLYKKREARAESGKETSTRHFNDRNKKAVA